MLNPKNEIRQSSRVLIITGCAERHKFFAIEAQRRFGACLCGIVSQTVESTSVNSNSVSGLREWIVKACRGIAHPSRIMLWLREMAKSRIDNDAWRKLQSKMYGNPLELGWPKGVTRFNTTNVNDYDCHTFIQEVAPDVTLVFGGRILQSSLLESAGRIFNFHYGIVPWYRCAGSTSWAVARDDVYNIGGSVHLVDTGIDSGDIIDIFQPKLDSRDSFMEIVEKIRRMGIERLISVGERVLAGDILRQFKQTDSGNTYFSWMLTDAIVKQVERNLRKGIIAEHSHREMTGRSRNRRRIFSRRATLHPGVYIMLYHSILGPNKSYYQENKVGTERKRFAEHLMYYRENFEIVTMQEAVKTLRKNDGCMKERLLVLAFDDAYKSVMTRAVPMLNHWSLPATIFVNHEFAARIRGYWRVRLSLLLGQKENIVSEFSKRLEYNFKNRETIFNYAKNEFSQNLLTVIDDLWNHFQMGHDDLDIFMTYSDLCELDEAQYELGSHTLSHPMLSKLPFDEAEREILGGHRELEVAMNRKIRYFSYPFGNTCHWKREHELVLQQLEDVLAVTAYGGVNRWFHPLHLRRIGVTNETVDGLHQYLLNESASNG